VFGRVSAHRLVEELGVEDPTIDFKMGDVIKARILQCRKRLPPKYMKIVELILSRQGHNTLIPGHAIVSIKPKYVVLPDDKISSDNLKDCANVKCKIPFEHLLDSYEPGDVVSANSIDNDVSKNLAKVLTTIRKADQKLWGIKSDTLGKKVQHSTINADDSDADFFTNLPTVRKKPVY